MKTYPISGCSVGFAYLGEKMKFYMSDGTVVVHVPDRKVISDEKYQSSLREVGESWYTYYSFFYFELLFKPKSDISFHLPALFGFKKLLYVELMKASIGHAKYILRKKEDPHVWKMMVDLDYLF